MLLLHHRTKQPVGELNPSLRIERPVSFPLDERAVYFYSPQWAGRRSNPRPRFFRPVLLRLSYRPSFLIPCSRCGLTIDKKRPGVIR